MADKYRSNRIPKTGVQFQQPAAALPPPQFVMRKASPRRGRPNTSYVLGQNQHGKPFEIVWDATIPAAIGTFNGKSYQLPDWCDLQTYQRIANASNPLREWNVVYRQHRT